jgi:hypothetical protein
MKKFSFLLVISFLLSSCSMFDRDQNERPLERNVPIKARNSNEPMKRVFVLPFQDISPNHKYENVKDPSRRVFVNELLRYGEFVVIKNSDFPKDFESFKTIGNDYDLEKIAEIAQGLGVNAVMEGQIVEVRAKRVGDDVGLVRKIRAMVEAKVHVRVFASEGKKEIFNETRTATAEATTTRFIERGYSDADLEDDPQLVNEATAKAFQSMVPAIANAMKKITWNGRIAMVRGEKIYINAGRASGIQVGDLLKVMDQGQDIYDPQTGTYLGRAEGRMKGTIEIVSYFGKDGAVGVVHSGADFKENDKVELY